MRALLNAMCEAPWSNPKESAAPPLDASWEKPEWRGVRNSRIVLPQWDPANMGLAMGPRAL